MSNLDCLKKLEESVASGRSLSEGTVLDRLEKSCGKSLKLGRNVIWGLPVDIEDQDPSEELSLEPVDRDAVEELMKMLRTKGFKVRFNKSTQSIVLK